MSTLYRVPLAACEYIHVEEPRHCWQCDRDATTVCEEHGTPLCGRAGCLLWHRSLHGPCSARTTHHNPPTFVGSLLWLMVAVLAAVGLIVVYVHTGGLQ